MCALRGRQPGRLKSGLFCVTAFRTRERLPCAAYVDAPDESGGKRGQHIHIKHDGLGFIPLNAVMKEETA